MNFKQTSLLFLCVSSLIMQSVPNVFAAGDADSRFNILEKNISTLQTLLNECENKGISADYETMDYTIIKKFITYGRQDIEHNCIDRANYTADKLEAMYDKTYDSLNAYLSGTKKPLPVNRYQTSIIDKEATHYIANVQEGKTGKIARDDVFFTGYMGYGELVDDIEMLPALGVNMMGLELGVNRIIIEPGTGIYGGWRIGYTNAANTTIANVENRIGQNGSKGLHITNNGGAIRIAKTIQVKPNTTYEIGCLSMNKSGSGIVITAAGNSLSLYNPSTRFATSKTTFTSGSSARMSIDINSNSAGENILDNIFIREIGSSENIIINSDFETEIIEKNGLAIDAGGADDIISSLKRAGKSNVAADLLISPHYFPQFVLNEDASYLHGGSGFGGGGVEWYKTRIKEVMTEYINALIPQVKDYPALMSICLSNEPMFNLMYSENTFATPMWRSWLEKKYKTIATLNSNYGTSYTSFLQVPQVTEMTQSQVFYDWKAFNEEMFAGWHEAMATQIKTLAPNLKIHAKMVDYLSRYDTSYEFKFMLTGTEANLFSDFSDIHGNDAHAYLESGHMYQMQSKLEWYDFLTTISEKPIHNSEDHIIMDRSKIYNDNQAKHVAADMWQGALHGRSSTTSWVYARTYDTSSLIMDSVLHRPEVMSAIGKTNFDLNRVATQMTALQKIVPEVGVLFSTASRAYSRNYMNCMYKAYEALLYSGYRTAVLDEKAMAAGKANQCKLLIIPDIQYMSGDMLSALKTYAAGGGKILVLGNDALKYNDYKKPTSSADINSVLQNAIKLPTAYSGNQLTSPTDVEILQNVRTLLPNNIKIVDKLTGEELSKTEYRYTDYNGKKLINICRYDWDNRNAEILVNGKKANMMYDVVNEKQITDLSLAGYTPVMLYIDTSEVGNPENVTATWDKGAYNLSWTMPLNTNIKYVNIFLNDENGTKLLEKVPSAQNNYSYKAPVNGGVTFTLQSESDTGFLSKGISVGLNNELAAGLYYNQGKIVLKGYSKTGDKIAYTVVPNGENPSNVLSLAAMGEIKLDKNSEFQADILLNEKTNISDDFTMYIGNGKEKQVLYFTYKKLSGAFDNLFATYNHDGYDIFWKCARTDVVKIVISDGNSEQEYIPDKGNAFNASPNSKKMYTITAVMQDGKRETVQMPMPIPLMFVCKTLDGKVMLNGIAQPKEMVSINIFAGDSIIFTNSVKADEYGRFGSQFVMPDDKIPQSEKFVMQILTPSDLGKTHEFIYSGTFPIHIGMDSKQNISFTNYTSHTIDKAEVVVAQYKNKTLVSCYKFDFTIGAEGRMDKILPPTEIGYTTKVFVWDKILGMTPISRAFAIEFLTSAELFK